MQHIIEKAMVPFRQSPNKIINKERAMMFVPKAGLDKPGLAGYNPEQFDINADSVVSLKISFLKNKFGGNVENGIGAGAIQQVPDGVADGFDFTGKNSNATDLDPSLTGIIPYGATGDFANSFGGKSAAIGKRASAEGTTTIAKGKYSHAEGDNSVTLGNDSHAEGYATTTGPNATAAHAEGSLTVAYGASSHAEGNDTVAAGNYSHTEGNATRAVGHDSHAEGYGTEAIGLTSHAEGSSTTAQGNYSHAEGSETVAMSELSHAEGYQTSTMGAASHAEGNGSATEGEAAHAEGHTTKAIGDYSHAEGYQTRAKGKASHAGGQGTVASNEGECAVGRYNEEIPDAVFSVGAGTDDNNRRTAFYVNRYGHIFYKTSSVATDLVETIEEAVTDAKNAYMTMTSVSAKANEALSIAKGAAVPLSFDSYRAFVNHFNSALAENYNVGQNVMIVTLNVPDLWIAYKPGSYAYYSFKDDDTFVQELLQTGTVQVGSFKFAALETQKIDATEYVKFTDYATVDKAGVVKATAYGSQGILIKADGTLQTTYATNNEITNKASYYKIICPKNMDHAWKVSATTNAEEWTEDTIDEAGNVVKGDKTKACETIGAARQSYVDELIAQLQAQITALK